MANTNVKGADEFAKQLDMAADSCQNEIAAALYMEALLVQKESMKRTPVDTGALRASHITDKPTISGNNISTQIRVGGPAAPYAVYVHEMTWLKHKVGQSKFLQSAIEEAKAGLADRVMKRVNWKKALGAK